MSKTPLVSVIVVDYKKDNPFLITCLDYIEKQTYKNFEIILVHDKKITLKYPRLKIKSYGHYVGPAEKRDAGARIAKGEILAFIDDDAYPDRDWLKNIAKNFNNSQIVGVGGPGITPPGVSWQEEASGWASASPIGAGRYQYRFLPEGKQYVDDYPSMNLAVRKADFMKVGGFDSNYWPGEDTKLCLDLTHKLKKKILYDPKVIVYHHRRPIWLAHLRQNGNFGLHRGFFARILPQTSFKLIYFLPSLLFLGLLFISLSYIFAPWLVGNPTRIFVTGVRNTGSVMFCVYFFGLFLNSIWILRHSNLFQAVLSIPVIFVTHLWYGIRFIQGFLFTGKLSR